MSKATAKNSPKSLKEDDPDYVEKTREDQQQSDRDEKRNGSQIDDGEVKGV